MKQLGRNYTSVSTALYFFQKRCIFSSVSARPVRWVPHTVCDSSGIKIMLIGKSSQLLLLLILIATLLIFIQFALLSVHHKVLLKRIQVKKKKFHSLYNYRLLEELKKLKSPLGITSSFKSFLSFISVILYLGCSSGKKRSKGGNINAYVIPKEDYSSHKNG